MGKHLFLFRCVAIGLVTFALAPKLAHAQAWVSDRGTLGLDLDYNFFTSDKVVTDTTEPYLDAGTTGHQITIGAEYTPIDKLAVTAALPIVALKYTGDQAMWAHAVGGRFDDGSTHTTATDLRVGTRYQVLDEPLALSPTLAFTIPVADYETIGNAVAGRHLKMAHLGLGLGYLIGIATYAHLAYEFTLAEKFDDGGADTESYSQNRSDLSFAIGTKLLDYRLDLHLASDFRLNHDGITFTEYEAGLPQGAADYHDGILKEQVFLVGAGAGYSITNTVTATIDFRYFVSALSQNTPNASVLAIGMSWSPQLGSRIADASIDADADASLSGEASARR